MDSMIKLVVLSLVAGALAGGITAFAVLGFEAGNQDNAIKDFYFTENAVHVSPHSVRKAMDSGNSDVILVDLRSQQEYETEHIVGAVSIPAYKDPDTSAYGDTERIVASFKELKNNNLEKGIVVYCYSTPCMTGRKIGLMLSEHGIYVRHLGIGWNEWRYDWNSWNHEHEWETTNAEEYIASGKEPGIPKTQNAGSTACPVDNEFGC